MLFNKGRRQECCDRIRENYRANSVVRETVELLFAVFGMTQLEQLEAFSICSNTTDYLKGSMDMLQTLEAVLQPYPRKTDKNQQDVNVKQRELFTETVNRIREGR
jgi:hypothetical protein